VNKHHISDDYIIFQSSKIDPAYFILQMDYHFP
jgi:hypothetical protein